MTVKELKKLKRQDLLQLMVEQSREALRIQTEREEKEKEMSRIEENNERLLLKVEEKDVQIERLKGRLDSKKARISELETEIGTWQSNRQTGIRNSGSVAEAALRLNGIVEAAQRAADQYLYNIRQRYGGQMTAICDQADVGSIGGSEG